MKFVDSKGVVWELKDQAQIDYAKANGMKEYQEPKKTTKKGG